MEEKEHIKIDLSEYGNETWDMHVYMGHHSIKAAELKNESIKIDLYVDQDIFYNYENIDLIIAEMLTGKRKMG